jgi:dTDP-4-amino-4,6-dideoxygalactose transaminase
VGYNSRLDEIQAAILRVKLRHLDAWIAARRERARLYAERFAGGAIQTPVETPGTTATYYLYTVRAPGRDALQAALAQEGIESRVYYPIPVYRQPALRALGFSPERPPSTPRAEEACRTILSIPMYPELPPSALAQVAENAGRLAVRNPQERS